VFDLDIKNNATASKDRTGLFFGKPEQKLTIQTGMAIKQWCNSAEEISVDELSARIGEVKSLTELLALYHNHPQYKEALKPEYEQRKRQILVNNEVRKQLASAPVSINGFCKK
jgi:hypothetical protein